MNTPERDTEASERIAVISDIHGNLPALDAVLTVIRDAGISRILNLGDSLYGPLWPLETARRIRQENMISIAGNEDRLILEAAAGPAHNATIGENFDSLDQESLMWLRSLSATATCDKMYMCHGTGEDDTAYLCEAVTEQGVVLKPESELVAFAGGIPANVILCGHSHHPRVITLSSGKVIVNPGSVGLPAYDDDIPFFHRMETGNTCACFCVLLMKGGALESVNQHYVRYDHGKAVAQALRNNRPDWARWLATGRA